MDDKGLKTRRTRGQRKGNIEIPQRFVDQLNSDGLDLKDVEVKRRTDNSGLEELTLDKLFGRYYKAREAEGAAERTLEDYVKHMRWLRKFLASEYSGLDTVVPNREVVRAWILHMITIQNLQPSTINIRLRTVKAMFNWAIKERMIQESPFDNVSLLKVPEEDFNVLTKAHERKLLAVCDLTTFVGLRDGLLISFLLDTGVRIGECMRVQINDVDLSDRSVVIRAESAKTRKARTIYFGSRTQCLMAVSLQWHCSWPR